MKKFLLLLVMSTVMIGTALAQRTVTGTVKDGDGDSLIGANVIVQGTTAGTVTNFAGTFSLEVPAGKESLIISYIGFISRVVNLADQNDITVTMEPDVIGLEDVMITGYTPQRRRDVTGSVASISSDEFNQEAAVGIEGALRGRAAGVQVFQASGTPGSAMNVRVRGSTSINASNHPLFILDGVPLIDESFAQQNVGGQDLNTLADLNPNDIESIEVLKDASAAAIYGNRAANGVVIITTKKGKAGRTKINLDASYGFQEADHLVELASAEQYREQMEALYGSPDFLAGGLGGDHVWYDEIFRTSNIANYSLSFSGGDEKTRFYSGLSYSDNQGIVKNTQFERYSARLNLDHIPTDKLTVGMNFGFNHSKNYRVRNDNNIYGAISVATLWGATVPVYNDDGSFASVFGWDNPVATVTLYNNEVLTNRFTGNAFGKYEIVDNLSCKASIGVDALDLREDVFEPSVLQSSTSGTAGIGQTRDIRWLTEYTLTYHSIIDNHNLTVLAGAGFMEDRIDRNGAQVVDFPTDDFRGLSAGATPSIIAGSVSGDKLNSYFGTINYSFNDRYMVTLTARADGSTRFVNDQWGFFPGASIAWRLSEEGFMSGGLFDELKLRVGWGQTGNNAIGNYTALQLYGGAFIDYEDSPGIVPTQLGNPDLSWETTTQINVGIDFVMLSSRIGVNIDYYQKKTKDLLLELPIPTTSGFSQVPRNVGEVENTGFEISVNAVPVSGAINWTVRFNTAYNKNEIIKLFNGQPIDRGPIRLAEGHPIGAYFGYVTDGLFQNQAEVEAHATQPGAGPGDIRFMDISGGAGDDGILGTDDDLPPDGVINDADRTFIGQGLPDWSGGLTNILNWKGLELIAFLQFSIGNDIDNGNLAFAEGMHSVFNTTKRAWEGRWQQEGDDEDFPRAVLNDPNNNRRHSTRMVEDGSFMRLKTASLGYTLPESAVRNIGLQSLRVYVSGTNLFTITDYSWFDPEVSWVGRENTALGLDFLTMPQPRSVVFGINVDF